MDSLFHNGAAHTTDDIELASDVLEGDVFIFPASFAQRRLWFLNEWEPGIYNIPMAVRLTGQMNVVAMEEGLREIIRRHEVLRTAFKIVDGGLVQVIAPHISFNLPLG